MLACADLVTAQKPYPAGIVDLPGAISAQNPIGDISNHPWQNTNVDRRRVRTVWAGEPPMKDPFKKPNVKPCKNRDLMIPDYSALSRQRALILAAALVSWSAITLGANTAQAQSPSPPPYPKGVWAPFGPYQIIPPDLVNN